MLSIAGVFAVAHLAFYLTFDPVILSGILTEILSDYLSAILSNMSSSILSGILSGTRFMSQRAGSLLSFGPGVTERISKLAIGFGSWRASLKSWQARQRAAVQRRLAHKLAMTCWQVSVVCAPPCLPACLRGCTCAGWGISRDFHLAGGEKGAKHPVLWATLSQVPCQTSQVAKVSGEIQIAARTKQLVIYNCLSSWFWA